MDDEDEIKIEKVLDNGVINYDVHSILNSKNAKRHLRAVRKFQKKMAKKKAKKAAKKEIKKPWCLYCYGTPTGVGKIIGESETTATVLYFEGQRSFDVWDKRSLQRFSTIRSAIKEYEKWLCDMVTLDDLKAAVIRNFPSQRKEILKIKS